MNFLTQLGLSQNNANRGIEESDKIQAQKMALQQVMQDAQAQKLAGSLFTGMAGGDSGAPPALPGASPLPWTGGGSPQAAATGLPNGGAPPVPNAAPMPPRPMPGVAPPQPAAPPPQMGGGQPTNGLSWQALAAQIKKQAPDADGATIMGVIQKYAPLMNAQSKQSLQETMINAKLLGMEFAHGDRQDAIAGRENVANINQSGANSRNASSIAGRENVANINQTGANNRTKDRIGAGGGLSYKTALQNVKTAQSDLNNLRNNGGKAAQIEAAVKNLQDAQKDLQTATKGSGSAPAATTVTVVSPDGTEGTIPADQLDDALSQGYKKK